MDALQTTVSLVIRKPSFPYFLATPFSQIRRSFSSLGNVKNLGRHFFPVASYIIIEQPKNEHSFPCLCFFLPSAILKHYTSYASFSFKPETGNRNYGKRLYSLYLLWSTTGIRSWTPVVFAYIKDLPNTSKFLIFHLFDADCSSKNLNDLELILNQELHAVAESGMKSNILALSILKEREAINRGNTVIDLEESG